MRRRRRDDDAAVSLDSFLDIVTNVVGVLILIAVVTVISAGDIAVSSGASSLISPKASASRILFHCSGDKIYHVDEEGFADRIRDAVEGLSADEVVQQLDDEPLYDDTYRVRAATGAHGLVWTYSLHTGARGDAGDDIGYDHSDYQLVLDRLGAGDYVYFVVQDDSFDVFQQARDVARARGLSIGWHPVEGPEPLRLSTIGSLGKKIQ